MESISTILCIEKEGFARTLLAMFHALMSVAGKGCYCFPLNI